MNVLEGVFSIKSVLCSTLISPNREADVNGKGFLTKEQMVKLFVANEIAGKGDVSNWTINSEFWDAFREKRCVKARNKI